MTQPQNEQSTLHLPHERIRDFLASQHSLLGSQGPQFKEFRLADGQHAVLFRSSDEIGSPILARRMSITSSGIRENPLSPSEFNSIATGGISYLLNLGASDFAARAQAAKAGGNVQEQLANEAAASLFKSMVLLPSSITPVKSSLGTPASAFATVIQSRQFGMEDKYFCFVTYDAASGALNLRGYNSSDVQERLASSSAMQDPFSQAAAQIYLELSQWFGGQKELPMQQLYSLFERAQVLDALASSQPTLQEGVDAIYRANLLLNSISRIISNYSSMLVHMQNRFGSQLDSALLQDALFTLASAADLLAQKKDCTAAYGLLFGTSGAFEGSFFEKLGRLFGAADPNATFADGRIIRDLHSAEKNLYNKLALAASDPSRQLVRISEGGILSCATPQELLGSHLPLPSIFFQSLWLRSLGGNEYSAPQANPPATYISRSQPFSEGFATSAADNTNAVKYTNQSALLDFGRLAGLLHACSLPSTLDDPKLLSSIHVQAVSENSSLAAYEKGLLGERAYLRMASRSQQAAGDVAGALVPFYGTISLASRGEFDLSTTAEDAGWALVQLAGVGMLAKGIKLSSRLASGASRAQAAGETGTALLRSAKAAGFAEKFSGKVLSMQSSKVALAFSTLFVGYGIHERYPYETRAFISDIPQAIMQRRMPQCKQFMESLNNPSLSTTERFELIRNTSTEVLRIALSNTVAADASFVPLAAAFSWSRKALASTRLFQKAAGVASKAAAGAAEAASKLAHDKRLIPAGAAMFTLAGASTTSETQAPKPDKEQFRDSCCLEFGISEEEYYVLSADNKATYRQIAGAIEFARSLLQGASDKYGKYTAEENKREIFALAAYSFLLLGDFPSKNQLSGLRRELSQNLPEYLGALASSEFSNASPFAVMQAVFETSKSSGFAAHDVLLSTSPQLADRVQQLQQKLQEVEEG